MNSMDMTGIITWPANLSPSSYEDQNEIYKFWMEVSGHVLATCCVIHDVEHFLEKLYVDEAVQHRITMVALACHSYHRVAARSISKMSDWQDAVQQSYGLLSQRPKLALVPRLREKADGEFLGESPPLPKDHRAYSVKSVIDIHAWDQAKWRGTAYAQFTSSQPPCLVFLYENEEAGRKIFERWRERFGWHDEGDEIQLSIIQQLPGHNEHDYCVLITSKDPELRDFERNQVVTMASRSLIMEPDSDVNLGMFLSLYKNFKAFYILPGFLKDDGQQELGIDLAILKHDLAVKVVEDIGENDPEAVTLRMRGLL